MILSSARPIVPVQLGLTNRPVRQLYGGGCLALSPAPRAAGLPQPRQLAGLAYLALQEIPKERTVDVIALGRTEAKVLIDMCLACDATADGNVPPQGHCFQGIRMHPQVIRREPAFR